MSQELSKKLNNDIGRTIGSQKQYLNEIYNELGLNISQSKLSRELKGLGLTTRKHIIVRSTPDEIPVKDELAELLRKQSPGYIVIDNKMLYIEISNGYGLKAKLILKQIFGEEIPSTFMDEDGNLLIVLRMKFNDTKISKYLINEVKINNITGIK